MWEPLDGHKNMEVCMIDYINFDEPIGKCKVEIYNNEPNIPHFHLFNENNSFHTCICIYENKYYDHEGKYIDKLSPNQCIQLNEWMKNKVKRYSFKNTRWNSCSFAWEFMNREGEPLPENLIGVTQPNY